MSTEATTTELTPVQKVAKAAAKFLFLILTFAFFKNKEALDKCTTAICDELKAQTDLHDQEKPGIFEMIDGGLDVVSESLHVAGEEKWADNIELVDSIVERMENNGGKPIAAAISAGFKKLFGKKDA